MLFREPFTGEARKTKTLAKRAVALQVCKRLHEDGLLNERLLPRKRVLECLKDDIDTDPRKPKIGTKRSKAYYKVKLADTLIIGANDKQLQSMTKKLKITDDQNLYLYKINLELVKTSSHTMNVKQYNIYDPAKFPRKLGILVGGQNPILEHPFDIFTLSGQITVKLELLGRFSRMPWQDKKKTIQDFHCFALSEVIGFNTELIKESDQSEYFLVPLMENEVDVDFLAKWESQKDRNSPWKFCAEEYVDSVVIPQHRKMENFFVKARNLLQM